MKKLAIIIILVGGLICAHAQSKIEGYEYWFNNDFANRTITSLAPTQQLFVNQNVSTSGLANGIHVFNFRSFDNERKYSATISSFFYKLPSAVLSSSNLVSYQYWLDDDYESAIQITTSTQQQVNINELVSMSTLADGIHVFNIRFKDDRGFWSSITSEFFYKIPSVAVSSSNLLSYEYWLDNDYANAVNVNTPAQQQVNINELISMSTLADGIHVFNIRFKDDRGFWSSITSEFFYKMPPAVLSSSNLVSYQYWLDNDYENAVQITTPTQQQVIINELVSMSTLADGIHVFNIRFKDDRGFWSSITSEFFYKIPIQSVNNNLIVAYRHWLNDEFENAISENLETPIKQFSLIDNLDFTSILKGEHRISFQFKDTLGLWSSVTTDSIIKVSLPVSDYTYMTQVECDSTVVYFTDLSIDGDNYLWDFGDGNLSALANPTHVYYTPNTYQVSLTVTDTLLGTDSIKVLPIEIISLSTASSITEIACDSYTAPDEQVYTTSGIKTAVITNAAGCDSTITIDLSILHSTESSIAEIACDSFTAPDEQVYTTSGIKTAVIPNAAGCDSTITIDLSILHSTESSIAEIACDSFTAPDEQVYTTSGIKTAVIPNAVGCDSTITIDLSIINVDVSVVQNGISLTAHATDAIYQWLDCNDDYAAIPGETNQSFTATQNGSYAVEVTQDICVSTSECIDITGVGLIENSFGQDIIVYPNPTHDIVNVDLGEILSEVSVRINDVNGKTISVSNYINTQKLELNLNVQPGIYLMTINSGDKKATVRFIRQ